MEKRRARHRVPTMVEVVAVEVAAIQVQAQVLVSTSHQLLCMGLFILYPGPPVGVHFRTPPAHRNFRLAPLKLTTTTMFQIPYPICFVPLNSYTKTVEMFISLLYCVSRALLIYSNA